MAAACPFLSVIVPLYNEEDSVGPMLQAILKALEDFDKTYEVIFVDDGSKDGTLARAIELTQTTPQLRVIEFRKNYGQTPAMAAGIDHARGQVLVTMDGDLQNDPDDIPMMLDTLAQGYDIVVGWRHNRQDKLVSRKIPSTIANRLIGKVTGVPIKDNGCSLKAYRAEVMKKMPFYSEMHRFIPALLSLSGARIAQVKVAHHARQFGESKYGLSRIYKVLFDLLAMKTVLSLIRHPTRWFARLAFTPLFFGTVLLVPTALQILSGEPALVIASTSIIFICLGVFLLSLGFICELAYAKGDLRIPDLAPLTARTYLATQVKPDQDTIL